MAFDVQLVSPEAVLFEGRATMVIARTLGGGDIAFQTDHAPFLGALDVWPVKVYLEEGGTRQFAVHGGFVEVAHNRVIILSDVAELVDDIDVERAESAMARAEQVLTQHPDDEDAQAAIARARVRLDVASARASG
jgi:F-type H+-transporting ATPase subunit epsilon